MKQDWYPEELAQHWTLAPDERELLGNKTGAARLNFAVLLKAFQFEGHFPDQREDVANSVVEHLSSQTGVQSQAYSEGEWSERTQRRQRARIRKYCRFRVFRAEDEPALVKWLSERVAFPNPETEAFKASAYSHLRSQQIEPPATERLRRLLHMAVTQREQQLVAETAAQLSAASRMALDTLVNTHMPENDGYGDQITLFPIRSELAAIKDGAGAVKVGTVLEEIAKLKQLRALGLPDRLFRHVPAKLVTHYRQRAASEPPRELRRHPPEVRYTMLAALCWQREQEITAPMTLFSTARAASSLFEGPGDSSGTAIRSIFVPRFLLDLARVTHLQPVAPFAVPPQHRYRQISSDDDSFALSDRRRLPQNPYGTFTLNMKERLPLEHVGRSPVLLHD